MPSVKAIVAVMCLLAAAGALVAFGPAAASGRALHGAPPVAVANGQYKGKTAQGSTITFKIVNRRIRNVETVVEDAPCGPYAPRDVDVRSGESAWKIDPTGKFSGERKRNAFTYRLNGSAKGSAVKGKLYAGEQVVVVDEEQFIAVQGRCSRTVKFTARRD